MRVKEDGSLGEETSFMQHIGRGKDPFFQSQAHPHSINASPDNRFAIVADLGLDKAFIYRFRADTGALEPDDPPFVTAVPGGGPRHFIFGREGRFAYLLSEMSGTVTVYAWDATAGILSQVQEVETIPHRFIGQNNSAEIAIHPNGAFLYESNRRRRGKDWWGPDSIGVFSIDPKTGRLTAIEQVPTQGTMPRHFAIDPSGSYLFAENELSGGVAVFRVNAETGRLSVAGRAIPVDTPVCIQFVPVK